MIKNYQYPKQTKKFNQENFSSIEEKYISIYKKYGDKTLDEVEKMKEKYDLRLESLDLNILAFCDFYQGKMNTDGITEAYNNNNNLSSYKDKKIKNKINIYDETDETETTMEVINKKLFLMIVTYLQLLNKIEKDDFGL